MKKIEMVWLGVSGFTPGIGETIHSQKVNVPKSMVEQLIIESKAIRLIDSDKSGQLKTNKPQKMGGNK